MRPGHPDELFDADGPGVARLPEGHRRSHHDVGVGVLQARGEGLQDAATRRDRGLELARAPPHERRLVAQGREALGLAVEAAPRGRPQGADAYTGIRVPEGVAHELVARGAGGLEAREHGAPFEPRYGVGIVLHERSEPRRRLLAAVLVLAIVVVVGIVVANSVETDQWAITPGLSQPVGPLITITGRHAVDRRSVFMTDVYLQQLSAWQYFLDWMHPVHVEFVSTSELTGGNTPVSQLDDQAYLEMYDSQAAAKVAAFRALGLRVVGTPSGARVTEVLTGAPAASALQVGDAITAANGTAVTSACGLVRALHGERPGEAVTLRVVPAAISTSGVFSFGASKSVRVRMTTVPAGIGVDPCGPLSAWLGIGIEDATSWRFPVHVSIDTSNIGGPSAGLAMTLGIIDELSSRSITGGLRVAATGTMSPDGAVGDVGGVAEKTIAVENAGATVFIVPQVEYGVAKAAASKSLRVLGVTSLAQALADLRRLGGAPPSANTDTVSAQKRS